jgi:hypothetical protein
MQVSDGETYIDYARGFDFSTNSFMKYFSF